jgi:hypothetical protein
LTPAIRAFLDDLAQLLDDKSWPDLDHEAVSVTPGHASARVVLAHRRDPERTVTLEVDDRVVHLHYGPERIPFTRPDEAIRFVEMLGDGRVELVVQRNPGWTTLRSYRDGLALPFRKSSAPWPNLRFRTQRLRFGFDRDPARE